jgi:hypothetical protein
MRIAAIIFLTFISLHSFSQKDTTVIWENQRITLPEVFVRNNLDYKFILGRIKEDTTFYKAFRNLRVIEFSSYNNIDVFNKNKTIKASYESKTRQHRENGCRTTEVIDEKTTGDFYDKNHEYNYLTAEMYASLFFAKGKVCGENNIVKGRMMDVRNKKGMDKHREQLKMLFFNPGKKIPGIPFIGDKLDLYDDRAHKLYDYKLDYTEYQGKPSYTFSITPKDDLGTFKRDDIVVDEMTTWFDAKTLEVLARNYSLSYKAGVYDFDVSMEVEMTKIGELTVPRTLRYKGNWNVIFKGRERAQFTATLFDFKQ